MSLRKRLEQSPVAIRAVSALLTLWIRLCMATSRGTTLGLPEVQAALGKGPILVVIWHSRSMLAPWHWRRTGHPMTAFHDPSPIGRVSASVQRDLGFHTLPMSAARSDSALLRATLRRIAAGESLGITADGPRGPALKLKAPPVDWARITGLPVFVFAFSTTAQRRARRAWDQQLIPLPFGRASFVYRPLGLQLPRKATEEEMRSFRRALRNALNDVTAEADGLLGLPPGP